MTEIYFDNAATTKIDKKVASKMYDVLLNFYGNPSSLHCKGIEAKKLLEEARCKVCDVISCAPRDLYFTSGASESNMIAILGSLKPNFRNGKRVITSSVEHKSVLVCFKKLESMGYEIVYVNPNLNGVIEPESVVKHVDSKTALVSLMFVNNETGDIYDIKQIAGMIKLKNPKTLIHCDVSQAFGKLDIYADKLAVDFISASAHKINGPKGIGCLYVKNGIKACLVSGGTQEGGVRMGTENVASIVGFGEVCKLSNKENMKKNQNIVIEIKNYITINITKSIENIKINSSKNVSPYILNLSVFDVPAQIMLNRLQEDNIFISTGSACSKNAKSYVLKAMGFENKVIASAIRVSFNKTNTPEEAKIFVEKFCKAVDELRGQKTKGR